MKRIYKHQHFRQVAALLIADGLFFGLTDPQTVHPIMLIVACLLLAATFYMLVQGALSLLKWYGIVVPQSQRLARLMTGVAAFLIALQSIGQLSMRDLFLLIPLALVAYLYSSYGRQVKQP